MPADQALGFSTRDEPPEPGTVPGFLLTRHWRDGPNGIEYQLWISTPQGPATVIFEQGEAVFFIARDLLTSAMPLLQPELLRYRTPSLKNFASREVVACYFRSQQALLRARERLRDARIEVLEGDIRPVERFLMERFVRAGLELRGRATATPFGQKYHNPRIRPGQWRPSLRVLSLDIETAIDRLALFSIGLVADELRLVFMVGQGPDSESIRYCDNEKALLLRFMDWLAQWDPDVIIGWNVVNFDLWYLQRLCKRHGIAFAIGRGKAKPYWRTLDEAGGRYLCDVPGRVILDGIEVIKAAQYRFESYALQHVATHILGEGKLLQGADRGEHIAELFEKDKPALAAYNLQDCDLVLQIFKQRKLVEFCIARSELTGLAMGRVGGSVAAFDCRYLPSLHRAGYVAPQAQSREGARQSPGGYVLDSRPGLYDNVLVLDFKSLYPSIIRSFCIDPLGMALAEQEPDKQQLVAGFNGAHFSRERHILPGLLTELWAERDRARSLGDSALAQAIKILMNSFYGVLGSPGCRFFDSRLASSITLRGHDIILQTRTFIEQRGYQVIYGDTDSLFVWVEQDLPEADIAAIGRGLAADLNSWWKQKLRRDMQLNSVLEVEFETHFLRFLMPTIRGSETGSKKRYAGTVRPSPGADSEMVFKGLETVRSDWTPLARRFQRQLYGRVFDGVEVEAYVLDMRDALLAGQLDADLVYRKRLRQPLDAYQRNVPPHVQAARKAVEAGARLEQFRRGRAVEYVITVAGPEAAEHQCHDYDYEHYVERQLAPIADGILGFVGTDFATIVDDQIALF